MWTYLSYIIIALCGCRRRASAHPERIPLAAGRPIGYEQQLRRSEQTPDTFALARTAVTNICGHSDRGTLSTQGAPAGFGWSFWTVYVYARSAYALEFAYDVVLEKAPTAVGRNLACGHMWVYRSSIISHQSFVVASSSSNRTIPEWRLFGVEDYINNSASCPIRDIQVGRNVTCDRDLHPNRQPDDFR